MNNKKKTVGNIIEGVIIAILIALIGGMLFLYFSFGETGAAPKVFGYTIYHTHATNMETKIPAGTVIFAKESEIDNIKAGSVVLCNIDGSTKLMRVAQLVSENGVMSYAVKYDTSDDTYKISRENVIAKAVRQDAHLGKLLDFATSTKGIMLVIIIPSFIIIVFQVIRIINAKRVEEDAYSLEDLDEIMLSHDDADDSFFSEPEAKIPDPVPVPKEPDAVVRIVRDDSAEPELKTRSDAPKQVLSVDKNGKAELKFTEVDNSQLFTYDRLEIGGAGINGGDEKISERADGDISLKKENTASFMSNVLPEKIAAAAGNVGQPANEAANAVTVNAKVKRPTVKAAANAAGKAGSNGNSANAAPKASTPEAKAAIPSPSVKASDEKTAINAARSIPAKAVVPKERLAPPPKKSNGRTISELMSIIDAEESKLK